MFCAFTTGPVHNTLTASKRCELLPSLLDSKELGCDAFVLAGVRDDEAGSELTEANRAAAAGAALTYL